MREAFAHILADQIMLKKQKLSDALSSSIGYTPPPPPPTSKLRGNDKPFSAPSSVSVPPSMVDPAPSTSGNEMSTNKIAAASTASAPPVVDQAQSSSANSASSQDEGSQSLNFYLLFSSFQKETLEELTLDFGLVQ